MSNNTRIGVAFISDRPADLYLNDCMGSFDAHCQDPFSMLGPTTVIEDRSHQLGMSGAVEAAWSWATGEMVDYLFHIEEDFVFRQDFSLRAMLLALGWGRNLAQMVLKRQPWSPEEQATGNMLSIFGHIEQQDMHTDALGTVRWVAHTHIFSLNPCLIPFDVFSQGYYAGNEAEATQELLRRSYRFGMFGGFDDDPIVEHVGHLRGEGWKL